jgi:hypothetical protein
MGIKVFCKSQGLIVLVYNVVIYCTLKAFLLVAGEHLRVCPQGLTCCTEEMEHNLSAQSRQEFDRAVRDTLSKLGTLLKLRAQRFDGKLELVACDNQISILIDRPCAPLH